MRLYLIDGTGPFFRGHPPGRINWSKIPFAHLERDGLPDPDRFERIREDFRRVVDGAAAMGFNAITLDDVAHLADHPDYPDDLRKRIAAYGEEFGRLFDIAASKGLAVYLTTDVIFWNDTVARRTGGDAGRVADFFAAILPPLFARFPAVAGVIFRIGESDGTGAGDELRSRLVLRRPGHVRRFLSRLFPVFESSNRTLVLRTWCVGAYRLGDLMWNRTTFLRAFDGIDSPSFVLSMKYGESDFFRYLPTSKQFGRTSHRTIVEFQARREYEGFGEYPAFTGWEYERHWRRIAARSNVVGISVWCQTGGWSAFRRLTFLDRSPWVELNLFCAIRLARDGMSTEEALAEYARERLGGADPVALRRFLRLADEAIRELLYIDEFAMRKTYFRRLRVPPLLTVYWDNIFIHHYVRQVLRCFVAEDEWKIHQGYIALDKVDEMEALAPQLGLPAEDVRFQRDTFAILAAAREYYFRPRDPETIRRIVQQVRRYREAHPSRYNVILGFSPGRLRRRRVKQAAALLFRDRRGYRVVDRLFTLRLMGAAFPLLRRLAPGALAEFADGQAMGWRTLFR
jgi:hypothetical protein